MGPKKGKKTKAKKTANADEAMEEYTLEQLIGEATAPQNNEQPQAATSDLDEEVTAPVGIPLP
jgi:hypothetical protein